MAAQDPDEPFDLYREDGAPLGLSKARADVHRDGDWHRSMHLWVLSLPEEAVILQRRSRLKDTWPLRVDVAVAGHYRAGETEKDVLREAEEEIGLVVSLAEATRLGTRFRADSLRPGISDNEIQDIYATLTDKTLEQLTPSAEELEGLYAVPLTDLLHLFHGETSVVMARSLTGVSSLRTSDFVPAPDGYWQVVTEALSALRRGRASEPFVLRGAPLPTTA